MMTTRLPFLYVGVAPQLPWQLRGEVVYHRFRHDDGGQYLGDEIDVVLGRTFNTFVDVLLKGAWFDGASSGPVDRWRLWFQTTFSY